MEETGTVTRTPRPSETLPAEVRTHLPSDFAEAIDFHGHLCPGLTIGYRAATIAMNRLGVDKGGDEALVGIIENDACGADAFQHVTGCTIGKGNLIYRDYGKQSFLLVRRADGRGIRVAMRHDAFPIDDKYVNTTMRNLGPDAPEAERAAAQQRHHQRAIDLLGLDEARFATISAVEVELPSKARIFSSVPCSVCGEPVMEARLRMRDGEPCCIPCTDRYGRGWEINH
jgi:formylmethanofuran dehydrogenase subunit E